MGSRHSMPHSRVGVAAIPDGDTVMSDPAMLRPLLPHIIENALKISPPESAVDISIARTPGEVEVRDRDRGPGIDPEFMERAFDPFTRRISPVPERSPAWGSACSRRARSLG